jgi:hypothetical protein
MISQYKDFCTARIRKVVTFKIQEIMFKGSALSKTD